MDITSPQNPRIKEILRLREKKSARRESKRFMVEGAREISRAIACGYDLLEMFMCQDALSVDAQKMINHETTINKIPVCVISQAVFAHLAVRDESDGLIATFSLKDLSVSDILKINPAPRLVVLENAEKPGNLGAILRSADGAGIDAVVCTEQSVDVYNPNVIRASIGAVFSVPVLHLSNESLIELLNEIKAKILVATPESKTSYLQIKIPRPPFALILGSEANGLSSFWRNADRENAVSFSIPMRGIGDSLNLSASAAILMYHFRSNEA